MTTKVYIQITVEAFYCYPVHTAQVNLAPSKEYHGDH